MSARVGLSLALTGPEAVYAAQMRDAIQLAVEDERRLHQLAIDLVVEDDQADATRAADVAQRLATSDVVAVVGPMNSWTCERQVRIFAGAGLAQITPSASNPSLSTIGCRTFFRLCASDLEQARVLAQVACMVARARSVGAVHDGTLFAAPLAGAFLQAARRIGLSSAPEAVVRADEPESFLHAADVVSASAPDAVFIAGLEEPNRLVARTIRSTGSRAVFLGTDALKPTNALVTEGTIAGPYLTAASADAAQTAPEFHRRFEGRFGRHHSIYTVEAYDAVRLVARAIRMAKTVDRPGVLASIREAGCYEGLTGAIRFDASGERIAPRLGVYRWNGAGLSFVGTELADLG
jgi:branched-chain amino acid transport system substrate-binding protein